jgi:hypothetical protein
VTSESKTVEFNSFFNLLVISAEEPECMETIAILNYHQFPFSIEEDQLDGSIRKEMGFSKDDKYPMLLIDSNVEEMPSVELAEKDYILSFLFNKE